jgi:hypothetical protein
MCLDFLPIQHEGKVLYGIIVIVYDPLHVDLPMVTYHQLV